MSSTISKNIAILVALLVAACNRAPSAEDVRIGRQAISIAEVSLLARSGYPEEALAAVKRRHVPEQLSGEEELQFRGFAKGELLAALKDARNILTPPQKDAYDEAKGKQAIQKEQAANKQSLEANNLIQRANEASATEQQEMQRRAQLSQYASQVSEQRQGEQTAREQEQLRSVDARWRSMEAQNDSHRTYGTRRSQVYITTPPVRTPRN